MSPIILFPFTGELQEKVAGNTVTGFRKQEGRTMGLEQPEEVNFLLT